MKTAFWAMGVVMFGSACLNAEVTLDFTGLSGTLTNQVADQGVMFSGTPVTVYDDTYFNVQLGTSFIDFVLGDSPGVTDSVTLTEHSIQTNGDSFFDGATVYAYDANGNQLGSSQTFSTEGPNVGFLPTKSLTFADAGINELKLVGIQNSSGGAFPLEMSFDTVTPEPSTIWLLAGGLIAAALLRRRLA